MSFKIDLHTHSIDSPDGSLRLDDYQRMLDGGLDVVAITDHNAVSFAQELQGRLGKKIIVGEEITTQEGEIIGLYLTQVVRPNLSLADAIAEIRKQGGLVYLPHPFEIVRRGVKVQGLAKVAKQIDIVEVRNGRAVFQNRSAQAEQWAAKHGIPGCASSDAHGTSGWGRTYTVVAKLPTRENLAGQLKNAHYEVASPGVRGLLHPKINRLKKRLGRA